MSSAKQTISEEADDPSKPALRRSSRNTTAAVATKTPKKPGSDTVEPEETDKIAKGSTDNVPTRRVSMRRLSSSSQNENAGTPIKVLGKRNANKIEETKSVKIETPSKILTRRNSNKIEKTLSENGDTPKRVSTRRNSSSAVPSENVETPGRVSLRRNSNKAEKLQADHTDTPRKIATRRNSNKSEKAEEEKTISSRSSSVEKDSSSSQTREGSVDGSPRRSMRLGGKGKGLSVVVKNLDPILEDVLNKSSTDVENNEENKPIAVNGDSSTSRKESEISDTEIDVVSLDELKTLPKIEEEEDEIKVELESKVEETKITLEPVVKIQKIELDKDHVQENQKSTDTLEQSKQHVEEVSSEYTKNSLQPVVSLSKLEQSKDQEEDCNSEENRSSCSESDINLEMIDQVEQGSKSDEKLQLLKLSKDQVQEESKLEESNNIVKRQKLNQTEEEAKPNDIKSSSSQPVVKIQKLTEVEEAKLKSDTIESPVKLGKKLEPSQDKEQKSKIEVDKNVNEEVNSEELDVSRNKEENNKENIVEQQSTINDHKTEDIKIEVTEMEVLTEDNKDKKVVKFEEKVLINESYEFALVVDECECEPIEDIQTTSVEDKLEASTATIEASTEENGKNVKETSDHCEYLEDNIKVDLSHNKSEEISAPEPMEVDDFEPENVAESCTQADVLNTSKKGADLDGSIEKAAEEDENKVERSYQRNSSTDDIDFHLTDEEEDLKTNCTLKVDNLETQEKMHNKSTLETKESIAEEVESDKVIEESLEKHTVQEITQDPDEKELEASTENISLHLTFEDSSINESDIQLADSINKIASYSTPKLGENKKSSKAEDTSILEVEVSQLVSDDANQEIKTTVSDDYIEPTESQAKFEDIPTLAEEENVEKKSDLSLSSSMIKLDNIENNTDSELVREKIVFETVVGGSGKKKKSNVIKSETSTEENNSSVTEKNQETIEDEATKRPKLQNPTILKSPCLRSNEKEQLVEDIKQDAELLKPKKKKKKKKKKVQNQDADIDICCEDENQQENNSSNEEKTKTLTIDSQLELKIDELLATVSAESEEEMENSFIDYEAEEGEEDTPSEGSNDIPDHGELISTSESEFSNDESYEKDSFIDDEEQVLLSGDEYDLSLEKAKIKTSRIIELSSDSDSKDNIVRVQKVKKSCKKKKKKSRIIKPKDSSDEEVNIEVATTEDDNNKCKTVETVEEGNVLESVSEDSDPNKDEDLDKETSEESKAKIVILEDITLRPPGSPKICLFKTNKKRKLSVLSVPNTPENVPQKKKMKMKSPIKSTASDSLLDESRNVVSNSEKKKKNKNRSLVESTVLVEDVLLNESQNVVPMVTSPEKNKRQSRSPGKSANIVEASLLNKSQNIVPMDSGSKQKKRKSRSSSKSTSIVEDELLNESQNIVPMDSGSKQKKRKSRSSSKSTSIVEDELLNESQNVVPMVPNSEKKKRKYRSPIKPTLSTLEDALLNESQDLVPSTPAIKKKNVDKASALYARLQYIQLKPSDNNGPPSKITTEIKNSLVGEVVESVNLDRSLRPSSSGSTAQFDRKKYNVRTNMMK